MSNHESEDNFKLHHAYLWVGLFAALLGLLAHFVIQNDTFRNIVINLASDCIGIGLLFLILNKLFLVGDNNKIDLVVESLQKIKAAISPKSINGVTCKEENQNWLWDSIKDNSESLQGDDKDRIKRMARKIDVLLGKDPKRSELDNLKQEIKRLEEQGVRQEDIFKSQRDEWQRDKQKLEKKSQMLEKQVAKLKENEIANLKASLAKANAEINRVRDKSKAINRYLLNRGSLGVGDRDKLISLTANMGSALTDVASQIDNQIDTLESNRTYAGRPKGVMPINEGAVLDFDSLGPPS